MVQLRRLLFVSVILTLYTLPLKAQETSDLNARIREEGMQRSQIMHTIHYLTDVYGPRLTGSPNLRNAGEWALQQLMAWGVENPHKDAWDWGHSGWLNERISAHIVTPIKDQLTCEVLAWTPSTPGAITAEVLHVIPPDQPTQEELTAYFAKISGRIDGKIVLVGAANSAQPTFSMPDGRSSDEAMEVRYNPYDTSYASPMGRRRPQQEQATNTLSASEVAAQVDAFLATKNIFTRVNPSALGNGLIRAFANRDYDISTAPPTVVLRQEDYGRIARLVSGGKTVTMEFDIVNKTYPEGSTEYNYLAEIPGTDKADEVIMLGGHLDSWHAATGATDNASGVAVMMEALRILKAVGANPRRTIRIAMWSAEEQGLLGSQAYVQEVFGSYENPTPAFNKFGGYINVDAGTGRLRGATVFGPVEAAVVLEDILTPFADLAVHGARASNSRRIGGSDYTAFNNAGLPGISMGQDPIQYFSRTWHTNIDNYEQILEDDLKQAAVVVAATAYHLAMRDDLIPRFSEEEMPAPPATN